MVVNGPLIRPYFFGGGVALGRFPGFPSMLWDLPPTMGAEAGHGGEKRAVRGRGGPQKTYMSDEKRAPGW